MRPADVTFATKTDAEVWLTRKEAEILNGDWINPDAGKVQLAEYGTTWIEERPNLRPRTVRLYRYLFRRHIQPHFGSVTIADIKEALGSDDDQALVFTSPMGTPLRHSNFYRRVWLPAVAKAGLPGIHFHDLRHAGNTLTADAGASLRELMDRMGHSSTRAALIYQHSSDERQRKLADAIGEAARAALLKTETASGTYVARETGTQP
jgi:integrase